jgi:DNA-binding beta-propeller fold protein YncE
MRHAFALALICALLLSACRRMIDPAFQQPTGYPPAVEKIITTNCATTGCHTPGGSVNAASLDLSTLEGLLRGGVSGAVVVPYSVDQSSLFQFINIYEDLGLRATPTMPINRSPLSRADVIALRDWIATGCPSASGEIPFSTYPESRGKAYISNQGCDLVSVVDAETRLVMRYVKVGHDAQITELPHCLRVSPDGRYWYVCYTNGQYVQKFDAVSDTLVDEVFVGPGGWNILKISPDSRYAYVSDFTSNGKLVEVDLATMTIRKTLYSPGLFEYPHGIAYSRTQDTVYVTAQYGNMIYRIMPGIPKIDKISLQPGQAPVTTQQLLDPHEILMSPDYSRYFITCQASNELRVMDARADTLLKVIPMGTYPLEFSISAKKNRLYVVCQEEANPVYPGFKGSVHVVNLNTLTVEKVLYERFYQPHGIAVDDKRGLLYVASRNADPTGPAPHHISVCNGRNGFFHVIDLESYETVKRSSELSVDPYSLDVRE